VVAPSYPHHVTQREVGSLYTLTIRSDSDFGDISLKIYAAQFTSFSVVEWWQITGSWPSFWGPGRNTDVSAHQWLYRVCGMSKWDSIYRRIQLFLLRRQSLW